MNQEHQPHTLSLFGEKTPEGEAAASASSQHTYHLALALTEPAWLKFLADEWWPSRPLAEPLLLGRGAPIVAADSPPAQIIAWVDVNKLAEVPVSAFRNERWVNVQLNALTDDDSAIAWHGPIPLFAVQHFTMQTAERVAHMTGLASSFANLEPATQPMEIAAIKPQIFDKSLPKLRKSLSLPAHWNALRGAASMALASAPTMTPWMDALCMMLNKPDKPSRAKTLPDIDTPWLIDTPWRYLTSDKASSTNSPQCILWRAALRVLAVADIRKDWRPHHIITRICDHAMEQGLTVGSRDTYLRETQDLLDDLRTPDTKRGIHDPVGLALQLVLLRPEPGNFMSWRTDLPLTPAVIWSGAILAGLLRGFKDLENRFKGSRERRKYLDMLLWKRTSNKSISWPQSPTDRVTWQRSGDAACLYYGNSLWTERKFGQRGQWYEADLTAAHIEKQAIQIAKEYAPTLLSRHLRLQNCRMPAQGSGRVSLNTPHQHLIVKGEVLMPLPENAEIETLLNHAAFKKWIATAALTQRLPSHANLDKEPALFNPRTLSPTQALGVDGLRMIEDFITPEQERTLVSILDTATWSTELKRRVQHYGWKYNYKTRALDQTAFLGPLPDWANQLAQRLFDIGIFPERPDQVIVNEYRQDQGISKHIDCIDCFRGPIVTISLLEAWPMIFRRNSEKIEMLLHRRSATIIDSVARHLWTHEIPQRKFEKAIARERRISLTFRKINY